MVTCVADLADVAAPGIPGAKTFSATSTAPIDPYTVITSAFSHSKGPRVRSDPSVVSHEHDPSIH